MTSYRDCRSEGGDAHCFALHRSCLGVLEPIFNFHFGIFYDHMMSSVHEEETASISSELSLSSGDESGENEPKNVSLIRPYQFEPEFSSGEEVEDIVHPPEEDDESRTTNLDW